MASQCPICKSEDSRDYQFNGEKRSYPFNGKSFSYKVCNTCELIYSDPLPNEDDLNEFYGKHFAYEAYERIKVFKKSQARSRADDLRGEFKLTGFKRILDVGAGHGYFVEALGSKGDEALGFDISASPSLRQLTSGKVYYLPKIDALEEKDFDLITMWHTLEHVPRPYPFMEEVVKRVKPGGKVLVAVPNARAKGLKTSGYIWNWFQEPYIHPLHFNADNLGLFMEKNGMKVVKTITRDTWDSNLGDSLPLFRKPKNVLVNTMPKSWAFYIHQSYRLVWTVITKSIRPLRSKDNGAELIVIAQKPG